MQGDLLELRDSTLQLAERLFAGAVGAGAFEEGAPMAGRGRGWAAARWVSVDERGYCEAAGDRWA
jgi:hypothetical protein